MKMHTIKEAIIETLKHSQKPLSAKDIYDHIVKNNFFSFTAKNPVDIVKSELRKYCEGLELKKSKPNKLFKMNNEGFYSLK